MIIAYVGGLGTYKTALMTGFGREAICEGRSVWSNYRIDYEGAEKLSLPDLMRLEAREGFMAVDELPAICDSRVSGSSVNRMLGYFALQSRKLGGLGGLDVAFTAQIWGSVDLRFRNMTDVIVVCLGETDGVCEFKMVLDGGEISDFSIPKSWFEEFVFPFYDTFETVSPMGVADLEFELSRYDVVKVNELVDGYVDLVMRVREFADYKSVFKFDVEDIMLRLGLPLKASGFVCNRLKARLLGGKKIEKGKRIGEGRVSWL